MAEKKGRVLCVDDEPHVLRALQWLLQKDFDIHSAGSAQEALRLLDEHDFDVVVSDQRMPGVTGVELLREVKKRAPRAMRILLTGYSDLDAMVRSVNESEVFRFITKPWDIKELPVLIADAAHIARTTVPIPAPAKAPAPQQVTTVAMHPRESVLVIDDAKEIHQAVAIAVGDAVQVNHAYSVDEAAAFLKQNPASVVVCEVRVANADATRLVRALRQKRPETVTIVLSGQADAATVMGLINDGQVFRYLPKPVKPPMVKLVVDMAMKRHRDLVATPAMQKRIAASGRAVA